LSDRCIIEDTTVEGYPALAVATGPLALAIIPALGGKISSLRDTRSGREWLWRHPRMAYQRVPHGSSYVAEADTGGWDECFPSVSACAYPSEPWADAPIQDHGELWSQDAVVQVEGAGSDQLTITTTWQGIVLPYSFERVISLRAGSAALRCDYTVRNQSDAPLPFVWCIHPLIAIEPGMELRFPPEARFNVGGSFPPGLVGQTGGLTFPPTAQIAGQPIDLAHLPGPDAAMALKLWSEPLAEGYTSLHAANGALHMRWDTATLPQVAVWMNLGAFAFDRGTPYYNMGLEPCIGAQDSLADAVQIHKLFATVPPAGAYRWWLEIELS
jgi:hypothetical protein